MSHTVKTVPNAHGVQKETEFLIETIFNIRGRPISLNDRKRMDLQDDLVRFRFSSGSNGDQSSAKDDPTGALIHELEELAIRLREEADLQDEHAEKLSHGHTADHTKAHIEKHSDGHSDQHAKTLSHSHTADQTEGHIEKNSDGHSNQHAKTLSPSHTWDHTNAHVEKHSEGHSDQHAKTLGHSQTAGHTNAHVEKHLEGHSDRHAKTLSHSQAADHTKAHVEKHSKDPSGQHAKTLSRSHTADHTKAHVGKHSKGHTDQHAKTLYHSHIADHMKAHVGKHSRGRSDQHAKRLSHSHTADHTKAHIGNHSKGHSDQHAKKLSHSHTADHTKAHVEKHSVGHSDKHAKRLSHSHTADHTKVHVGNHSKGHSDQHAKKLSHSNTADHTKARVEKHSVGYSGQHAKTLSHSHTADHTKAHVEKHSKGHSDQHQLNPCASLNLGDIKQKEGERDKQNRELKVELANQGLLGNNLIGHQFKSVEDDMEIDDLDTRFTDEKDEEEKICIPDSLKMARKFGSSVNKFGEKVGRSVEKYGSGVKKYGTDEEVSSDAYGAAEMMHMDTETRCRKDQGDGRIDRGSNIDFYGVNGDIQAADEQVDIQAAHQQADIQAADQQADIQAAHQQIDIQTADQQGDIQEDDTQAVHHSFGKPPPLLAKSSGSALLAKSSGSAPGDSALGASYPNALDESYPTPVLQTRRSLVGPGQQEVVPPVLSSSTPSAQYSAQFSANFFPPMNSDIFPVTYVDEGMGSAAEHAPAGAEKMRYTGIQGPEESAGFSQHMFYEEYEKFSENLVYDAQYDAQHENLGYENEVCEHQVYENFGHHTYCCVEDYENHGYDTQGYVEDNQNQGYESLGYDNPVINSNIGDDIADDGILNAVTTLNATGVPVIHFTRRVPDPVPDPSATGIPSPFETGIPTLLLEGYEHNPSENGSYPTLSPRTTLYPPRSQPQSARTPSKNSERTLSKTSERTLSPRVWKNPLEDEGVANPFMAAVSGLDGFLENLYPPIDGDSNVHGDKEVDFNNNCSSNYDSESIVQIFDDSVTVRCLDVGPSVDESLIGDDVNEAFDEGAKVSAINTTRAVKKSPLIIRASTPLTISPSNNLNAMNESHLLHQGIQYDFAFYPGDEDDDQQQKDATPGIDDSSSLTTAGNPQNLMCDPRESAALSSQRPASSNRVARGSSATGKCPGAKATAKKKSSTGTKQSTPAKGKSPLSRNVSTGKFEGAAPKNGKKTSAKNAAVSGKKSPNRVLRAFATEKEHNEIHQMTKNELNSLYNGAKDAHTVPSPRKGYGKDDSVDGSIVPSVSGALQSGISPEWLQSGGSLQSGGTGSGVLPFSPLPPSQKTRALESRLSSLESEIKKSAEKANEAIAMHQQQSEKRKQFSTRPTFILEDTLGSISNMFDDSHEAEHAIGAEVGIDVAERKERMKKTDSYRSLGKADLHSADLKSDGGDRSDARSAGGDRSDVKSVGGDKSDSKAGDEKSESGENNAAKRWETIKKSVVRSPGKSRQMTLVDKALAGKSSRPAEAMKRASQAGLGSRGMRNPTMGSHTVGSRTLTSYSSQASFGHPGTQPGSLLGREPSSSNVRFSYAQEGVVGNGPGLGSGASVTGGTAAFRSPTAKTLARSGSQKFSHPKISLIEGGDDIKSALFQQPVSEVAFVSSRYGMLPAQKKHRSMRESQLVEVKKTGTIGSFSAGSSTSLPSAIIAAAGQKGKKSGTGSVNAIEMAGSNVGESDVVTKSSNALSRESINENGPEESQTDVNKSFSEVSEVTHWCPPDRVYDGDGGQLTSILTVGKDRASVGKKNSVARKRSSVQFIDTDTASIEEVPDDGKPTFSDNRSANKSVHQHLSEEEFSGSVEVMDLNTPQDRTPHDGTPLDEDKEKQLKDLLHHSWEDAFAQERSIRELEPAVSGTDSGMDDADVSLSSAPLTSGKTRSQSQRGPKDPVSNEPCQSDRQYNGLSSEEKFVGALEQYEYENADEEKGLRSAMGRESRSTLAGELAGMTSSAKIETLYNKLAGRFSRQEENEEKGETDIDGDPHRIERGSITASQLGSVALDYRPTRGKTLVLPDTVLLPSGKVNLWAGSESRGTSPDRMFRISKLNVREKDGLDKVEKDGLGPNCGVTGQVDDGPDDEAPSNSGGGALQRTSQLSLYMDASQHTDEKRRKNKLQMKDDDENLVVCCSIVDPALLREYDGFTVGPGFTVSSAFLGKGHGKQMVENKKTAKKMALKPRSVDHNEPDENYDPDERTKDDGVGGDGVIDTTKDGTTKHNEGRTYTYCCAWVETGDTFDYRENRRLMRYAELSKELYEYQESVRSKDALAESVIGAGTVTSNFDAIKKNYLPANVERVSIGNTQAQSVGYQQPQSDGYQQPQPVGCQQPQSDAYQQPQSVVYQLPESNCYQQPQSDGYQQPQSNGYQQSQSVGYQQPQSDGYQQPQSDGYQQPQSDGYQQSQSVGYQQTQSVQQPELQSSAPRMSSADPSSGILASRIGAGNSGSSGEGGAGGSGMVSSSGMVSFLMQGGLVAEAESTPEAMRASGVTSGVGIQSYPEQSYPTALPQPVAQESIAQSENFSEKHQDVTNIGNMGEPLREAQVDGGNQVFDVVPGTTMRKSRTRYCSDKYTKEHHRALRTGPGKHVAHSSMGNHVAHPSRGKSPVKGFVKGQHATSSKTKSQHVKEKSALQVPGNTKQSEPSASGAHHTKKSLRRHKSPASSTPPQHGNIVSRSGHEKSPQSRKKGPVSSCPVVQLPKPQQAVDDFCGGSRLDDTRTKQESKFPATGRPTVAALLENPGEFAQSLQKELGAHHIFGNTCEGLESEVRKHTTVLLDIASHLEKNGYEYEPQVFVTEYFKGVLEEQTAGYQPLTANKNSEAASVSGSQDSGIGLTQYSTSQTAPQISGSPEVFGSDHYQLDYVNEPNLVTRLQMGETDDDRVQLIRLIMPRVYAQVMSPSSGRPIGFKKPDLPEFVQAAVHGGELCDFYLWTQIPNKYDPKSSNAEEQTWTAIYYNIPHHAKIPHKIASKSPRSVTQKSSKNSRDVSKHSGAMFEKSEHDISETSDAASSPISARLVEELITVLAEVGDGTDGLSNLVELMDERTKQKHASLEASPKPSLKPSAEASPKPSPKLSPEQVRHAVSHSPLQHSPMSDLRHLFVANLEADQQYNHQSDDCHPEELSPAHIPKLTQVGEVQQEPQQQLQNSPLLQETKENADKNNLNPDAVAGGGCGLVNDETMDETSHGECIRVHEGTLVHEGTHVHESLNQTSHAEMGEMNGVVDFFARSIAYLENHNRDTAVEKSFFPVSGISSPGTSSPCGQFLQRIPLVLAKPDSARLLTALESGPGKSGPGSSPHDSRPIDRSSPHDSRCIEEILEQDYVVITNEDVDDISVNEADLVEASLSAVIVQVNGPTGAWMSPADLPPTNLPHLNSSTLKKPTLSTLGVLPPQEEFQQDAQSQQDQRFDFNPYAQEGQGQQQFDFNPDAVEGCHQQSQQTPQSDKLFWWNPHDQVGTIPQWFDRSAENSPSEGAPLTVQEDSSVTHPPEIDESQTPSGVAILDQVRKARRPRIAKQTTYSHSYLDQPPCNSPIYSSHLSLSTTLKHGQFPLEGGVTTPLDGYDSFIRERCMQERKQARKKRMTLGINPIIF